MKRLSLFFLSIILSLPVLADTNHRVVCHDPSIFIDTVSAGASKTNPYYYIYGSHLGRGKTNASVNYQNWTTFKTGEENAGTANSLFADLNGNLVNYKDAYNTHKVTEVKDCNGNTVKFGNFNAHDWQYKGFSIQGNQWAPDVIWNKKMKKWCMYMSINGDRWASVIVCLTSDNPEGPWVYQGPVVFSGFQGNYEHNGFSKTDDYKQTDLEIAIGTQTSLPERYQKGDKWGEFWPNCIDPCVFYDQKGNLWMSYGSWSGGIFIIRLNEENGLRDYEYKFEQKFSSGDDLHNCISDPYFGKKIAGGYYVSGEASYIEYINGYYYLFMSYGGFVANGGYQMRIFRSENPDGPYLDCNTSSGIDAVYNKYILNYSADAKRDEGVKLFGGYQWGSMPVAEIAQGHNSAIVDHKGRALLVYHTRFNDGTEGHQVRVHQLFQNQDGWLVAAPYEFSGETVNTTDIFTHQSFSVEDVAGTYNFMAHPYRQNTAAKEFERPVSISLNADGSVSGAYSGNWELVDGTDFINLNLKGSCTANSSVTFKGVLVEQTVDYTNEKTLCFTALSSSSGLATAGGASLQTRGLCVWGSKASNTEIPDGPTYYPESQNKDLTSAWWTNFSAYYTIAAGESARFVFKNHSDKKENWHNWAVYASNAERSSDGKLDKEYFGIRADNWNNTAGNNENCVSDFNWETFKNDMDGSTVDMTITYLNGKLAMSSNITTTTGTEYHLSYTCPTVISVDKVVIFFVSEGSYISEDGLGIDSAVVGEEQKDSGIIYDIYGRRLKEMRSGLNIINGKKVFVK